MTDLFWICWVTAIALCLLILTMWLAAHGQPPQPFHIDGRA